MEKDPQKTDIAAAIERQHGFSEVIVSWTLVGIVALFALIYFLTPKAYSGQQVFEALPFLLGIYLPYLVARLVLAYKRKLNDVLLAASTILDVAMHTGLVASWHVQYMQPVAFSLKAPTFAGYFVLIALRALAFRVRHLVIAGSASIIAWSGLLVYAVHENPELVTHSFTEYATSNRILVGAEVEKLLTLFAFSATLIAAVYRTRRLLFAAVASKAASRNLSRVFSPEIAQRIAASGSGLAPGRGEHRTAAILMMDLRGFTKMSLEMPANAVMKLLADYQARMVGPIFRHGGTVDKFMGDGIMAHFGAASPTTTYAADCLKAVFELETATLEWNRERVAAGLPELNFGIACAVGDVIFGAVGDKDRLELTTIGEAVNLAAKLEKHTKALGVVALATETMYYRATEQGFVVPRLLRRIPACEVSGVPHVLNLIVLAERAGGGIETPQSTPVKDSASNAA